MSAHATPVNPASSSQLAQTHVISWNLTQRCNLKCEHCYIEGGPLHKALIAGELKTQECLQVIDQICEVNDQALLILTGGEPLLRPDVFEIAHYASQKGLWCVMGTNGVLVTERLVDHMAEAGIRGVSLSLDALNPDDHDRFRGIKGAWRNTCRGSAILRAKGLPFIVQTTIGTHNLQDLAELADMACDLGAQVFNVYFLVPSGRGTFISDISAEEYEQAMLVLVGLQTAFDGRMMINAKCAPHYQRVLYSNDPQSKFLKSFGSGAGGCPAGTHYCGIRPNGQMTPCPYLPQFGGNLKHQSFREIWESSPLFQTIRQRKQLGGACGSCEFSERCGGCRARAFGHSGNMMASDPWCVYEPGQYGNQPIRFEDAVEYGMNTQTAIHWCTNAKQRLDRVPSFVRGMVIKKVETYARERQLREITVDLLDEIRGKISFRFGKPPFAK